MTIRFDKFTVGDIVTWSDDHYADLVHTARPTLGDGPFIITDVFDRENVPPYEDGGQSTWSSMGHTQHVIIDGDSLRNTWSGAYFRLVTE